MGDLLFFNKKVPCCRISFSLIYFLWSGPALHDIYFWWMSRKCIWTNSPLSNGIRWDFKPGQQNSELRNEKRETYTVVKTMGNEAMFPCEKKKGSPTWTPKYLGKSHSLSRQPSDFMCRVTKQNLIEKRTDAKPDKMGPTSPLFE